jgi:pimeloyl-ACP methyl ester carboxylesterase
MTLQNEQPTIHSTTSKDGTSIGYQKYGQGQGLALVQGSMGSVENFRELAQALADTFTVYVIERRGRGISGPTGDNYSIQKEVEDLDAVLKETSAHYVFGLSSGAIISLQAAMQLPSIQKLAIFEPPLFMNGTYPKTKIDLYRKEIAAGETAGALVTAMQAGQFGPSAMRFMPYWLLKVFVKRIMAAEEKASSGNYISMRDIAPTLQNDFRIVEEMNEKVDSFKTLQTPLLLLNGDKSPAYLQVSVNTLAKLLPHAKHVVLPGLSHAAPWNYDKQRNPEGKPSIVAEKLRLFFLANSVK